MNAFIWNGDGFGDQAKHRIVIDAIREHRLDCVVLSETGRGNFSSQFLNHLVGGRDFSWFCLPPRGRSGGILAGFDGTSLVVNNVDCGHYCVKFHLKCKKDGFEWALVAFYGAAQDANKPDFSAELVRVCESESLPMMVGGDFNIIRW
jgi:hypothetical protein